MGKFEEKFLENKIMLFLDLVLGLSALTLSYLSLRRFIDVYGSLSIRFYLIPAIIFISAWLIMGYMQ